MMHIFDIIRKLPLNDLNYMLEYGKVNKLTDLPEYKYVEFRIEQIKKDSE